MAVMQDHYKEIKEFYGDKCILTYELTRDLLDPQVIGDYKTTGLPCAFVIDDMGTEIDKNPVAVDIFTAGCHHLGICCHLILQNLFQGRSVNFLTMQRNAQ